MTMALGTWATTAPDVAFFSPPPHRPHRPERRSRRAAEIARSVLRAFLR